MRRLDHADEAIVSAILNGAEQIRDRVKDEGISEIDRDDVTLWNLVNTLHNLRTMPERANPGPSGSGGHSQGLQRVPGGGGPGHAAEPDEEDKIPTLHLPRALRDVERFRIAFDLDED